MMTPLPRYKIIFHTQVLMHLRALRKNDLPEIRSAIENQLVFEPGKISHNRKPLSKSILESKWELRCGKKNQYRIFYKIYKDELVVNIIAIGEKKGNRLFIGNEEFEQ